MADILLLNGPNLNLLGQREPSIYGDITLSMIEQRLIARARELGHDLACFQSNHEGQMVERIHACLDDGCRFIIINPAAFTHTSIALRDALLGVSLPFIEVHLSNVHAREPFRQHSFFSDKAMGVIAGLGEMGYEFALEAAHRRLLLP
ncbi:MAG: type II 3-dehydroquinate dehydratase [Pseudomonadales bacterium]|nr:type II 3-dehydroquinate dehydratase [Pseudomonadales bacterium]